MGFRSARGRTIILDLCDRHTRALDGASTTVVETRHGSTNVVTLGPRDAPPLVFLHGMGLHAAIYGVELQTLARAFRVVAPDTPGHPNRSSEKGLPVFGPGAGEWLQDVLRALHVESAYCVGHSLGGYNLLKLAQVAPQAVRGLVLWCSAGLSWISPTGTLPLVGAVVRHGLRARPGWGQRAFGVLGGVETVDPALWTFMEEAARHYLVATHPYPVFSPEQVASFQGPVLGLHGQLDPFYIPERQHRGITTIFPRATSEILPGQAHLFSNATRQATMERVTQFFTGPCSPL